ncbi:hypothetical protein JCM24511_05656 [Saitozyma sp. JCM 24511]|nr:hypothetical protein JCM24511_05656 [Saitozyma sp. JCM 24511]
MPTTEPHDSLSPAHPDILRRILSFAEEPLLATCLRVNHTFFDVAGSHLYETIDAREDEYDFEAIVAGAAIGDECQQGGGQQDDTVPTRTNFKGLLLKKIKRLHLGQHPNWRKHDLRAACGHMASLQFIHIWGAGSASEIRGRPGLPASTPDKAVYEMSQRITIVIPNVVSSLQRSSESYLPEEVDPMLRNTRILFTGQGREQLVTSNVERMPWDDPAKMHWLDLLWNPAVNLLYCLLDLGAEIHVLKNPEGRLAVRTADGRNNAWALTPAIAEHRFRLDELNDKIKRMREIGGITQDPTKLIKGRRDYLQLSDTADELDEETIARLRADEAAAQHFADGGTQEDA